MTDEEILKLIQENETYKNTVGFYSVTQFKNLLQEVVTDDNDVLPLTIYSKPIYIIPDSLYEKVKANVEVN